MMGVRAILQWFLNADRERLRAARAAFYIPLQGAGTASASLGASLSGAIMAQRAFLAPDSGPRDPEMRYAQMSAPVREEGGTGKAEECGRKSQEGNMHAGASSRGLLFALAGSPRGA